MDENGTEHIEQEMVGAYVLDALSPEEAAAFESHLTGCERCRAEVAELRQVVDILPLAAEPMVPPAAVKERLMRAIRAEESISDPAEPAPHLEEPISRPVPLASRRRAGPPTWALAAVAAVLIIGLGIWNIELQQATHHTAADRVAALIAAGARVTHVPGTGAAPAASAALIQPLGHKPAYLVVRGLPPNAPNHVYQVWLVKGSTPTSAGTFRYRHGTGVVALPVAATGYAAVAVTQEPGPRGSPQPTGKKLLLATLTI